MGTKSFAYEVVERSNTTIGTGAYLLNLGAPNAYRKFRDQFANGENEIVYMVRNATNTKWEKNRFGTLTYGTPDQLTRAVVDSTNGGAAVVWDAGDWPLTVYIPFDHDAQESQIRGWYATVRNTLLRFGHWFHKDQPSSGKAYWKIWDGVQDIILGTVNTVDHTLSLAYMPPGALMPYAGSSAPTGFLLCQGQNVSRTTYAALFAVIGTTYGVGDGSSTFTLPDLRGRTVAGLDPGAATGRLTSGGAGINSATLGAAGGAQTEAAGVSVSGTVTVGGSTSGSIGLSGSMDGPNQTWNVADGPTTVAGGSHTHALGGVLTSGTLTVGANGGNSMTGATAVITNTQPTIVLNYLISTGGVA